MESIAEGIEMVSAVPNMTTVPLAELVRRQQQNVIENTKRSASFNSSI